MQGDSSAGGGDIEERCLLRLVELATRLRAALNGSSERALQLHSALSGLLDDCAVLRRARKHGRALSCTPRLIVAGRAEEEGKRVMDFLSANHALRIGAPVTQPSRSTTPPTAHEANNSSNTTATTNNNNNGLVTMFDLSLAQGSLPSPGRSFNTLVSFTHNDSSSCSSTTSSTSSSTRGEEDALESATAQSRPASVPIAGLLRTESSAPSPTPPPSLSVSRSSHEAVTPSSTVAAASTSATSPLTAAASSPPTSSSTSAHTASTTTVPELDTPNPLPITSMPSPVDLHTLQLDGQTQCLPEGGTSPPAMNVTVPASGTAGQMSGTRQASLTPLNAHYSPPLRSAESSSRSGSLHHMHHYHHHSNSTSVGGGGSGPSPTSSRSGQTFITFVLHNDESVVTRSAQPSPNTLAEPSTPILSRRPHHNGPLSSGSGGDESAANEEAVTTPHEAGATEPSTKPTSSPRRTQAKRDKAEDKTGVRCRTPSVPRETQYAGEDKTAGGSPAHQGPTSPAEPQTSENGMQDIALHAGNAATTATTPIPVAEAATNMNTAREQRGVAAASLPCLPTALAAQRQANSGGGGHSPHDCPISQSIITLPLITAAGMASAGVQAAPDTHSSSVTNATALTSGMTAGGGGPVLHGPRPPVTAAIAPNGRRPLRRKHLAAVLPRYMPRLGARTSPPPLNPAVPSNGKMNNRLMMLPPAPTRPDATGTQLSSSSSPAVSGQLPASRSPSTPSLPPLPSSRAATPTSPETNKNTAAAAAAAVVVAGRKGNEDAGRVRLTPTSTARTLSLSSMGPRTSEERPPSTPAKATSERTNSAIVPPAKHGHDMSSSSNKEGTAKDGTPATVRSIVTSPTKHSRSDHHHAFLSANSLRQSRPSPYTSFTILNQRVHKTFSGCSLSAHMLRSPWEMPQYSNNNDYSNNNNNNNISSDSAYYVPVPRMIEATVLELLQRTYVQPPVVHTTSASQMSLSLMRAAAQASSRSLRQPIAEESESVVMMPPLSSSRRLLLPTPSAQHTGSFCTHSTLSEARLARRERQAEEVAAHGLAEPPQGGGGSSNGSGGASSRGTRQKGEAEESDSGTNTTNTTTISSIHEGRSGAEQAERPHTSPFVTPLDKPHAGPSPDHHSPRAAEGDCVDTATGGRQPSPLQLQLRSRRTQSPPSCITRHECDGRRGERAASVRRQGSELNGHTQPEHNTSGNGLTQGKRQSRPHVTASWTIQYVGDGVLRCAPLDGTGVPCDRHPRARSANAISSMLHNSGNNNGRCRRGTPLTPNAPATVLGDAFLYCIDCAEVMNERSDGGLRRSLRALFHPFGGAELERCANCCCSFPYGPGDDTEGCASGPSVSEATRSGHHATQPTPVTHAACPQDTAVRGDGREEGEGGKGQLTCAQRRALSQAIAQQTWFVLTRAERVYGAETSAAVQRYDLRPSSSTAHTATPATAAPAAAAPAAATAPRKGLHAGQPTKTTALEQKDTQATCDVLHAMVRRFIAAVRRLCGVEVAEWQVLPLSGRHSLAARDFLTVHYYCDLLRAGVLGQAEEGHAGETRGGSAGRGGATPGAQPMVNALHYAVTTTPSSGSTASTTMQNTLIPSPPSLSTRHPERLLSRQGSSSNTTFIAGTSTVANALACHGRNRPSSESSHGGSLGPLAPAGKPAAASSTTMTTTHVRSSNITGGHVCETMPVVPSPPPTPPPPPRPTTMAATAAAAALSQMSHNSPSFATLPPSQSATLGGRTNNHGYGSKLGATVGGGAANGRSTGASPLAADGGGATTSSISSHDRNNNSSSNGHAVAVMTAEEVLSCEAERYAKAVLRGPHDFDTLCDAVAHDHGAEHRETDAAALVQVLYHHAVQDMWYRSGAECLARVARLLDRHAFSYLLSRAALSLLTWSAQLLARLPYMQAMAQERLQRMQQRHDGLNEALRRVAESRAKQRVCTPHSRLCALHDRLQSAFEHVACHFLGDLRALLVGQPSAHASPSLSSASSLPVPPQQSSVGSVNASQVRLGVPALPAAYERLRQKVAAFVAFYRDAAWERRIAALRDELQALHDAPLAPPQAGTTSANTEAERAEDVAAQRRRLRQEMTRLADDRHHLERGLLQHLSQLNTEIINCFVAVCCYSVLPRFTTIVEDELCRVSDENTAILQTVADSGDLARRAPFVPLWRSRRMTAPQLGLVSLPAHQTLGRFVTALRAALCEDQIRALARYHDRCQRLTRKTSTQETHTPLSGQVAPAGAAETKAVTQAERSGACGEGAHGTAPPVQKERLPSPPPLQPSRQPSVTVTAFMSGLLPEPTSATTLLWQELEETSLTTRTASLVREWLSRHGVVGNSAHNSSSSQHAYHYLPYSHYAYNNNGSSAAAVMAAGTAASSTSTVVTLAPPASAHRLVHAQPAHARSATPSVVAGGSRPMSCTRRGRRTPGGGGAPPSSPSRTRSAGGKPHSVITAAAAVPRMYRATNLADYVTSGGSQAGLALRPQTNASLVSVPLIDFAAPPTPSLAAGCVGAALVQPSAAAYSMSGRNEDAEEDDGGVNSFSRNVPLFFWASTSVLTSRASTNRNNSDSYNAASGAAGSKRCSEVETTGSVTPAATTVTEAATTAQKTPSAAALGAPAQLTRKETAPYRGCGPGEPGTMAAMMNTNSGACTEKGMTDDGPSATTAAATAGPLPCHSPPDSSSSSPSEGGMRSEVAGTVSGGAAALYATDSASSSASSSAANFQPLQVWCQRQQQQKGNDGGAEVHGGTMTQSTGAAAASLFSSAAEQPMIWLLLQTWERSLLAMSYDVWMEVRCEHYAEVLNQYAVEVLSAQQEWQSELDRSRARLAEQMRLVREELANMTVPTTNTLAGEDGDGCGGSVSKSQSARSLEQEARQTLGDTHVLLHEVNAHRASELAAKLEHMRTDACRSH